MATYTAAGYLIATGGDISADGLKGFFDANPTYGSCVLANAAGPKPSYIFNLLQRMDIGSSSSMKAASTWNCSNQHITIIGNGNSININGRVRMGDQNDGTSANGGSFTIIPSDGYQFRIDGGDLWLYGSQVYIATQFFSSNVGADLYDVRMIDCDVEAEDGMEIGSAGTYDLTNSRIHHTGAVGLKAPVSSGITLTTNGLRIQKCLYGIQPSGTMTFSDVKIDTCTHHIIPNIADANVTFVNPDFTTLRMAGGNPTDVAAIEFRYQIKITDAAGTPLTGASLRARDQQGATRFDTVTNASGNPTTFTQGTLQNSTFVGNGGGTADKTDRANHTIRVRHPQYLWTDLNRSATTDNLGDSAPLVADVLFTYSLAAAAAITGVTITDHGGAPVAWNSKNWGITITGDLTVNAGLTAADIFHFIRSKTSYTATFGGKSGLDWHQMQQSVSSTVRSTADFYSGVLKGVRIVDQAGNPFTGVITMQADDGTIYTNSSVVKGLAFTGLVAGSQVKIFNTGTQTELFTVTSSGTSETWSIAGGADTTVDYTVMQAGYLPIRVTGITVNSAVLSTPIQQVVDRSWVASSGLTFGTNTTANTGTKRFTLNVVTTVQNFYSHMIEAWIAETSLKNKAFPLVTNGPNSFSAIDGWEFSTEANISAYFRADGFRYVNSSGVRTAVWAAIQTAGVPSGTQVRYQQSDGGTTVNAITTGEVNELIKIFGDASHGNFNRTGYLVIKAQRDGYDQAEVDVFSLYGTLEDQLYVVGLTPLSNGLPTGDPSVTTVSVVDSGASPVSWNGGTYSLTINDSGTTSGTNIMRWLRYNFGLGNTVVGGVNGFNWHDLVQLNGSSFKTVRGKVYGDVGAAIKGVRVLRSGIAHPDFTLHLDDNNVAYVPPQSSTITLTGVLAGSRVQIYDTANGTQLLNSTSVYSYSETYSIARTIRIRVSYVSGANARNFIETTIGSTSVGNPNLTFNVSQTNDATYNSNGVNGSAVTGITFTDAGVDIVNCNIAGGSVTWATIYAAFVYWNFTATGIANDFTYVAAPDTANYILSSMKIKNTSAGIPLSVTGGYGRDATSGLSKDIIDTTGGFIFLAPDHVVPFATGSGVTAGDITNIASAVLSAANTTPIAANIEKVNNITIVGDGAGTPWGP